MLALRRWGMKKTVSPQPESISRRSGHSVHVGTVSNFRGTLCAGGCRINRNSRCRTPIEPHVCYSKNGDRFVDASRPRAHGRCVRENKPLGLSSYILSYSIEFRLCGYFIFVFLVQTSIYAKLKSEQTINCNKIFLNRISDWLCNTKF